MNDQSNELGGRTSGLALASLALGILGFLVIPILGPIAGIICGLRAKHSIEHSGGRQGGRELAVAGIVLSSVGLAVWSGLLLFGFGIDALRSIF
jgi:hypothetical protein